MKRFRVILTLLIKILVISSCWAFENNESLTEASLKKTSGILSQKRGGAPLKREEPRKTLFSVASFLNPEKPTFGGSLKDDSAVIEASSAAGTESSRTDLSFATYLPLLTPENLKAEGEEELRRYIRVFPRGIPTNSEIIGLLNNYNQTYPLPLLEIFLAHCSQMYGLKVELLNSKNIDAFMEMRLAMDDGTILPNLEDFMRAKGLKSFPPFPYTPLKGVFSGNDQRLLIKDMMDHLVDDTLQRIEMAPYEYQGGIQAKRLHIDSSYEKIPSFTVLGSLGSKVVGYISFDFLTLPKESADRTHFVEGQFESSWEISRFTIDPTYRRQNFAKVLLFQSLMVLKKLEPSSFKLGFQTVTWQYTAPNLAIEKLYKRMGFKVNGEPDCNVCAEEVCLDTSHAKSQDLSLNLKQWDPRDHLPFNSMHVS